MNKPIIEILGGRVIDPSQHIDKKASLFIQDKKVLAIAEAGRYPAAQRLDASGLVVCPGFIDLNANCREPGFEHIATIKSETEAAIQCGITTLVSVPNLRPVIDHKAAAELIINRAKQVNVGRVLPTGALTTKLKGKQLAEMAALKQAGCAAVSNAWHSIKDVQILLNALNYAKSLDWIVIFDLADADDRAGVVDESVYSASTGLPASPKEWELISLYRYLKLVEKTQVKAHFSNISCRESTQLIAQAKQTNPYISADTAITHLCFTHQQVEAFDTLFHVKPPLRSADDQQALLQALQDGILDTVISAHQPWQADHKCVPFAMSEPGASTIDSLIGQLLMIAEQRGWSDAEVIDMLTQRAANCLNLPGGSLQAGVRADFCLIDLHHQYTLQAQQVHSAGKNSPFVGQLHRGQVMATYKSGKLVYQRQSLAIDAQADTQQ